jgi:hypothetical protein
MSDGRDSFNLDDYLRGDPAAPGLPRVPGAPRPPQAPVPVLTPTREITLSRPRTGWLLAAAASALCGLLLAMYSVAVNSPVGLSVAAWVLAAWGGTLLLALYRHVDAREQAKPGYVLAGSTKALGVAVPILIVAGAVLSSLGIATWAGGA